MDTDHSVEARTAGPDASQRSTASPRVKSRSFLLTAVVLVAIAAVAWYFWPRQPPPSQTARNAAAGRPVTVAAATVTTASLPVTLDALGTVTPLATVTVRTQISGYLTRIGFQEGQHVRKGDFLAEVDPRPYQAALDQAEGTLAKDQALLRNAEVDLARYQRLINEDSIARQQLDTQASLVRQLRATLKVDQALVEQARLNLDYCHIVSPIDGRVGLRLVDAGNYVQPGDTGGIVVITQMKPMTVVFPIPEDDLPEVLARMRAGAVLPVRAFDRTGTTELATGVLSTVDNRIDTTTGTVKLKATFDNTDEQLFPNQFVTVRLLVDTIAGATVVPKAAVQNGPQGTFVYAISADDTVSVRDVAVGESAGETVRIRSGLKPGERVVTDGVDHLRDGSKVRISATAAPGAAAVDRQPGQGGPGHGGSGHGGSGQGG